MKKKRCISLLTGNRHSEGGEQFNIVDNDGNFIRPAELEDHEYIVCKNVLNANIKIDNEEAFDALKRLSNEINLDCENHDERELQTGDVIICRKAVLNFQKHTFEGTLREFINEIQKDAGCNLIMEVGGEVKKEAWQMTQEEFIEKTAKEYYEKDLKPKISTIKRKLTEKSAKIELSKLGGEKAGYKIEPDELRGFAEQQRFKITHEVKGDAYGLTFDEYKEKYKKDFSILHRNNIDFAVSEGKIVPPEILADYPELKKVERPATEFEKIQADEDVTLFEGIQKDIVKDIIIPNVQRIDNKNKFIADLENHLIENFKWEKGNDVIKLLINSFTINNDDLFLTIIPYHEVVEYLLSDKGHYKWDFIHPIAVEITGNRLKQIIPSLKPFSNNNIMLAVNYLMHGVQLTGNELCDNLQFRIDRNKLSNKQQKIIGILKKNKNCPPMFNNFDDLLTDLKEQFKILEFQQMSKGGDVYDRGMRPSPKESATLFEEGYAKIGQDGNLWKIVVDKNRKPRWQKVKTEIHFDKDLNKIFIRNIKDVSIYSVSGDYIRKKIFIDYTMGGHRYVGEDYKFIPDNEIWIDENSKDNLGDFEATILHEVIEYYLMKNADFTYTDAHNISSESEQKFRDKFSNLMTEQDIENLQEKLINQVIASVSKNTDTIDNEFKKLLTLLSTKYEKGGEMNKTIDEVFEEFLTLSTDVEKITQQAIENEEFERRLKELEKYIPDEELKEERMFDKINMLLAKENLTQDEVNFLNENAFRLAGYSFDEQGNLIKKTSTETTLTLPIQRKEGFIPELNMILTEDATEEKWQITGIEKKGYGLTFGYKLKNLKTGKTTMIYGIDLRQEFTPINKIESKTKTIDDEFKD